ncbi:hypothetical protein FA95DRAFT_710236 [Auriscalpium vulgare]|uniref:Uncharacterized protein n=1 Tax=Auriscalpium vulgare TaxID=40419 RepID=A0ACB8RAY5_9AGAM|nr:hypothetical protein FA95DRAFT_710236 [Auriscalpium vulgare]
MSANDLGTAPNGPQSDSESSSPRDVTATLPNEVLLHIFSFIPGPDSRPNHAFYAHFDPVYADIIQVSRRWRAIALACPQLWTYFDFRYPTLTWHGGPVKDLLALSKSEPLVIIYDDKNDYEPADAKEPIVEHIGHIKELRIRIEVHQKATAQKLTRPAPMLEILSMSSARMGSGGSFPLPKGFLGDDAPRLQSVDLAGVKGINWVPAVFSGHALTSLKVVNSSAPDRADHAYCDEILGALARMPSLVELTFVDVQPTGHTADAHPGAEIAAHVRLPRLAELRVMNYDRPCCKHIEDRVRIPWREEDRL